MLRRLLRLVSGAAALATGCNPIFGIHEGKPRPICADPLMIDDMEDGDSQICEVNGRHGAWYTVTDGTSPNLHEELPMMIPGGRENSRYAAHFTGSGFSDWGALMGFGFTDELGLAVQPNNASTTGGIKFWMKSTAPVSINFLIPETVLKSDGGDCVKSAGNPNCRNNFSFEITRPSSDWVEYSVPFLALTQQQPGSAMWNPKLLLGVQFLVGPSATFDVWVDDVQFYYCSNKDCVPTCTDPAFLASCPANDRDPAACLPTGTDCAVVTTWCADLQLIDDMEDGNAAICNSGGRRGSWYVSSDGTSTDLTPKEGADFVQTMIPGGRDMSHYAAHFTGSGFTDFGALMGFALNAQPTANAMYDARGASGITFWMKSNVAVSVSFPTVETNPPGQGGECLETGGNVCNIRFAFPITAPRPGWEEYRVPFSALSQNDGSAAWDPSHLLNIDFAARRDTAFDVWVDDVRFYNDCSDSDCLPTCTDPAFPVQCRASALAPAGCRRQGTDCATFVPGCAPSNTTGAPADGLIATFMGADSGSDIAGDIFTVGDPAPTYSTDGALHIVLTAPTTPAAQTLLVVDHFKDCVDASSSNGVEFSISGFVSGCKLATFTEDSVHLYDDGSPPATHGTSRAGFHPAFLALADSQVTLVPQTLRVPFAALSSGFPLRPIDEAKITGVGWVFLIDPSTGGGTPFCVADLTIDDVRFY